MCQNNEDDINSVLESKPDFKKYQKCLKCGQNPVVVTRVSEALCKPCFMEYFVHKFRATVGKNVKKLLERDELVLFAYSASGSSVAMLNLLAKGVGEEAKKKFTFQPVVLYIEDKVLFDPTKSQADRIESLKEIKKTCYYSNFRIYFSLFENCLLGDDSTSQESLFTDEIEKLEFNSDRTKQFLDLVNESSNGTSREELLKRLKLKLINNVAKRLKISKIMLATNCTKLTIDLLNNVSIGKGAHVSWETSLEEKRPDGILYLRPFRELTSKEIAFYNHFIGKNDSILSNNSSLMNLPNSTIYRLTEKFICGLQSDYPSTVSTLFRTSDKLTPCDDLIDCNHMCCLCESPLDTNSSAIDDLEFSRSLAKLSLNNNITEDFSVKDENHNLSEFCYSCSVIIGDLKKKQNLPLYLKEKLRENMKSKINDCLIQD